MKPDPREVLVTMIEHSELNCSLWSAEAQLQLATDILYNLSLHFNISPKKDEE